MKRSICWIFLFLLAGTVAQANTGIYQAGTFTGLMNAYYTGSASLASLAKKGNLGLGASNGLTGEMILIDGRFYETVAGDGSAEAVVASAKTPFAMVVDFTPQQKHALTNVENMAQLENVLAAYLRSDNLFYIIKIDGHFKQVQARSIRANAESPQTLPFLQAVKANENINDFQDIEGSLVIFKSPDFVLPISIPGYHVHFISKDRKKMGHVYKVSIIEATAQIQEVFDFSLLLPDNEAFLNKDLAPVSMDDITRTHPQ